MARPRTVSDDEIVDRVAAHLAAREFPLTTWTLADVSPAAGLSPAGLVKRFGSRAGLMRALGRGWVASIPEAPTQGTAPVLELRQYVRSVFGLPSAAAASASLGDLFADISDPVSAEILGEGFVKQRHYVAQLIGAAQLPRAGAPARAARVLLDALHGGVMSGAVGASNPVDSPDETITYFLELWT